MWYTVLPAPKTCSFRNITMLRVITDCRVIDVFHPACEDFRRVGFVGYGKS
jgi:hypothetical protein